MAVSAFCPVQTGEIVALKKVALRRLEDGIPNQALREIKSLQEIGDNQYVSETGTEKAPWPALLHSLPLWVPTPTLLAHMLSSSSLIPFLVYLFNQLFHSLFIHSLVHPLISSCTHSFTKMPFCQNI